MKYAEELLLTDYPLIFSPIQLASCALNKALKDLSIETKIDYNEEILEYPVINVANRDYIIELLEKYKLNLSPILDPNYVGKKKRLLNEIEEKRKNERIKQTRREEEEFLGLLNEYRNVIIEIVKKSLRIVLKLI